MKTENKLNEQILKITMTIKEQYPELMKYLEEMPEAIRDEKKLGITQNDLQVYYDSLNLMLTKYKVEHPLPAK